MLPRLRLDQETPVEIIVLVREPEAKFVLMDSLDSSEGIRTW